MFSPVSVDVAHMTIDFHATRGNEFSQVVRCGKDAVHVHMDKCNTLVGDIIQNVLRVLVAKQSEYLPKNRSADSLALFSKGRQLDDGLPLSQCDQENNDTLILFNKTVKRV
jgi:iron-sulfur cluster repair protein YtfE (RIC family)